MLSRGGALLHSAAVGTLNGGVLIAGPSGSGKSTTALACQEAGLGFTSDDYVLVSAGGPPTVHMAYSTAKVVRASLGDAQSATAATFAISNAATRSR